MNENKLFYIRLKNGENLISTFAIANDKVLLTKPLAVYIESLSGQDKTLLMIPWIPQSITESDHVYIPVSEVLYNTDLNVEVETYVKNYVDKVYNKERKWKNASVGDTESSSEVGGAPLSFEDLMSSLNIDNKKKN